MPQMMPLSWTLIILLMIFILMNFLTSLPIYTKSMNKKTLILKSQNKMKW